MSSHIHERRSERRQRHVGWPAQGVSRIVPGGLQSAQGWQAESVGSGEAVKERRMLPKALIQECVLATVLSCSGPGGLDIGQVSLGVVSECIQSCQARQRLPAHRFPWAGKIQVV